MVALLRGHIRGGTQPTGTLVGILALPLPPIRVVIPGVRRPFGGHTGRAGGLVHYALYEPGGVL
jgi:hypothetical protein